jgi:hypothetical protein
MIRAAFVIPWRIVVKRRSGENSDALGLRLRTSCASESSRQSNETRAFSIEIRRAHYIFPAMTFSKPGGTHG